MRSHSKRYVTAFLLTDKGFVWFPYQLFARDNTLTRAKRKASISHLKILADNGSKKPPPQNIVTAAFCQKLCAALRGAY
jgi:hypothetical protein